MTVTTPQYVEMNKKSGQLIRVLSADDDSDDRELFSEVLSKLDLRIELTTVDDGAALMRYLGEDNEPLPDIIFLDINMPCKNGKDCVKEIRNNNRFIGVPVVMFSTSTYKEDIEETFASGANLYVAKPYSFQEQLKIMTNIFHLNWLEELFKHNREKFVMQLAMVH